MALSTPRNFYGVHSVAPYNRTTGLFYGILKVLQGSSLSLEASLVELMGGSQKYSWAVEDGEIKAEMALKFAQFEDFCFELFLGKAPSSSSAESSGNVSTLTNKNGTSCKDATTGIASIAVTTAANIMFGRYVVKVVSATTVDVYLSTDADMSRGSSVSYQSDLLKITASALTITTSGATTVIPGTGLTLTGGSGTIGMTVGDTATFNVRPINSGYTTVTVGAAASQTMPEFGAIVMAQKRGTLELCELDIYRCKAAGMPIGFEPNAWAKTETKVKCFYDSTRDGVFDMRYVKGA